MYLLQSLKTGLADHRLFIKYAEGEPVVPKIYYDDGYSKVIVSCGGPGILFEPKY
jgi:hypothetical protein